MLSLFLAYILFSFISKLYLLQIAFVLNNAPRVNTYLNELPVANYSMPPIAFAFFEGDPYKNILNVDLTKQLMILRYLHSVTK